MKRGNLIVAFVLVAVLLAGVTSAGLGNFINGFFTQNDGSDNKHYPDTSKSVKTITYYKDITCKDSDGGIFSGIKGNLAIKEIAKSINYPEDYYILDRVFSDRCDGDNAVIDYYCGTDSTKKSLTIDCIYGCSEGSCRPIPVCGNGVIDSGEDCDGFAIGTDHTSCGFYNEYSSGQIKCGSDCKWDYSDCVEVTGSGE